MADDDLGSSVMNDLAAPAREAYKKANSLYHLFTGSDIAKDASTPVGEKYQADPANLKRANDSFLPKTQIPTQTKAQKRPTVSAKVQVKTSVKPSVGSKPGGGK